MIRTLQQTSQSFWLVFWYEHSQFALSHQEWYNSVYNANGAGTGTDFYDSPGRCLAAE